MNTTKQCGAAPSGRNAPTQWRCAKLAGHKYLHETETGGVWGDNTFEPELTHRQQVIAGLRELATFLEDHPDLPAPYSIRAQVGDHEFGTDRADDAACRAAVDAAAAIMGSTVRDGEHYEAEREFGPAVTLVALHIPARVMDDWRRQCELGERALEAERAGIAEDCDVCQTTGGCRCNEGNR